MGLYDGIAIPVQGQPISSSNFGKKVRDAILDLDRRVASLDSSGNTGRAYGTSSLVLNNTTETAGLTIVNMTFKAGIAYQAEWKGGVVAGTAGNTVVTRVRKYNATPGSGADWGDLYRTEGLVGSTRSAGGTLYLLNNTTNDVTSDVNLNHVSSSSAASGITIAGSANSPRWFTIKPVGFATDYAGMGVQVS